MPQDDKLYESLQQVADIAATLGRIEAIERQFNEQVKGIETRVTSLETSVEKYQKQVDRIESTINELNLFLKGKSSLTDELQNLLGGLKDLDVNKLTGELNEVEKSTKVLNKTIQGKKDKQKRH
ncbi:MAG: hypothetical protein LKG11_06025 [Bacilli bacterium]|jgi:peptidoglycan hydrolase CwlO-like protein|nr:hypothetical protein [Bacilli bacterium]